MYATLVQLVVIPWRGFRCFTLGSRQCSTRHANARVVIPWRGFRCFTRRRTRRMASVDQVVGVVIPWRGFRCFTPKGAPWMVITVDEKL